jgi:hypothetical protein
LREILLSDVAFVEQKTAGFYGLSSNATELTQVTVGPDRPGFLTRLGFLAYNGSLSHPDPIHRGVDINNRFLCAHISPPAGEIPPLPDAIPGQTNRQRVEAHTGDGFCGSCHATLINPPGFALENFDPSGRWRDRYLRLADGKRVKGSEVDAGYTLPDGREFVAPGENAEMEVELIQPIAMDQGLRFAIREGGRTVGSGVVTEVVE